MHSKSCASRIGQRWSGESEHFWRIKNMAAWKWQMRCPPRIQKRHSILLHSRPRCSARDPAAIGMVEFLATTTQGQITAFIIVIRRFAMLHSLLTAALPLPREALVDANVFFGPRLGDHFVHSG